MSSVPRHKKQQAPVKKAVSYGPEFTGYAQAKVALSLSRVWRSPRFTAKTTGISLRSVQRAIALFDHWDVLEVRRDSPRTNGTVDGKAVRVEVRIRPCSWDYWRDLVKPRARLYLKRRALAAEARALGRTGFGDP